jgi:FtsH-binding integral membrane protein
MNFQEISQERAVFYTNFYSKVYFFFGLAILSSTLGAYLGLNYLASYFLASPALIYGLFILELILIFTSKLWSRRAPLNYVLFLAFTLITGLTIVPLLSYVIMVGGIGMVIKALLATALMFTGAAVFGATTKRNLQGMGGFLMMSLLGMIVVSILGIFIPWGNQFEIIFSGFGIIVFSGFAMYDIQKLKSYDQSQYIDAALQLYLDIFNLFIYILRLILSLNRN